MLSIGNIKFKEYPLALAPMEDISDPPFRTLCKEYGADLMFTEFISSEGLIREAAKSKKKLDIFDHERPIGIQIFGAELDSMLRAFEMAEKVQPDLLDINFGCPVKKVTCKGAGAAILKDIKKMEFLTREIVKRSNIPVTVKTRLGWDNAENIEEVAYRLQDAGISALSIHGRTRKQMYKGTANWEPLGKIKRNPKITIPLFGNGDINSPQKALEYKEKYKTDGIMIGRAAIGTPWFFAQVKHYFKTGKILPLPSLSERIEVCQRHLELSKMWKGERLGVLEMRKHYANYFRSIPNSKEIRVRLNTLNTYQEIMGILDEIKANHVTHDAYQ